VRDRRDEKDPQELETPEQQAPSGVTSVEARRAMHSSGAPPRQPCCPEFPAGEQPMDRASIPGSERVAVPAPVRSLPGRGGRHNIDQGSGRGDTHSYRARSDEVNTQVPGTRALRIRRALAVDLVRGRNVTVRRVSRRVIIIWWRFVCVAILPVRALA
jgi:hypothetical protein